MSERSFTVPRGKIKGFTIHPDVELSEMWCTIMENRQHADYLESIEDNRRMCFSDKTLRGYTFDKDDCVQPKLSEFAHDYVDHFREHKKNGLGVLFYGTVGTGKTFMSACIANALIDSGYSCYMTTFSRISNKLQSTFEKQDVIDDLMKYDLLIIDDLATERDTEYMNEVVITVIDERYRCGKPLIVTTNLTGSELKNPADINKNRLYSRLFEMCQPI